MNKTPAEKNLNDTSPVTLYSLLAISSNATLEEIKKAYRRIALLVHPDKNQNDPNAAEKFRNLNQAYKVLSDPEKRKVYDVTGEYEENELGNINDTYEYFREIYPRIKLEDIESFEKNYKGSLMEKEDLIEFYEEKEGDLTLLLQYIPLSQNKEVKRFIKIYRELIDKGELEEFDKFNETKNAVELIEEEEEEEKEESAEADESLEDLKKQIMENGKKRINDNFYNNLARKYGEPNGIDNEPQIDDGEFKKIQSKLLKKNKRKAKMP